MTLKNSVKTLPDVLQGIKNLQYDKKRIRIVFVDGGSTDGSLKVLEEFRNQNSDEYDDIKIISGSYDITEGRNICIHNADGDFILFIDSDVVVPPGLLSGVERLFSSDPRLAFINVPCVVEEKQQGWVDKFFDSMDEPIGMSCAAIKISALKEVGPYFIGFPGGGENPNELVLRLRKKGYRNTVYEGTALHIKQKPRGFFHYVKSCFYSSSLHHLQEIKAGNRFVMMKYGYYTMLLVSLFLVTVLPYLFISLIVIGVIYYLIKSKGDPIVLPALLVGVILPIGLIFHLLKGESWEQKYKKNIS
ncbi:MAG: glycosyltransferase family 2 protein [Thaumarchaeota archaeon]|nr:glycosyltransferase family 2 protein [Nitrososphaerota archaeon]